MEKSFGNIVFSSKFDSGNLARVEEASIEEDSDKIYVFNIWTRLDCEGTIYENSNRSWFYFSVTGVPIGSMVQFNIMNLNRHGKLFGQGFAPVTRTIPGKLGWERVSSRVVYDFISSETKILTFHHKFTAALKSFTYFAFTYPWSYEKCQTQLEKLDRKYANCKLGEIYYYRELLCLSKGGNRIDLITISNFSKLTECEDRIDKRLFPEPKPRCQTFRDKKVYFLSARVHPGETPSSFVYKGFIEFLLRENDERSVKLRKRFVFKIIPMLNPDGVKCGHYRTNLEGINLNRMYMGIPDFEKYPSIYAVKSLLIYYHFMNRMDPNGKFNYINALSKYTHLSKFSKCLAHFTQPNLPAVKSNGSNASMITNNEKGTTDFTESSKSLNVCEKSNGVSFFHQLDFTKNGSKNLISVNTDFKDINIDTLYNLNKPCSGIAFYFDLHAHASKRGCFFYGNHFETEDEQVDNILFAKLMALNTPHFDFNASNFSFKNMYMKDSNRMSSKEGSGRVSICKTFGLINSYTLECNYNMGRIINKLSPVPNDVYERTSPPLLCKFPPKYTPTHYEQIGRALAISALDFINDNPLSRLNTSEYFYLNNVRDVIRRNLRKKCEKLKHKQKDEPKIITFSFKNVDNFLKENKIANNFKMCDEFSVNSINSNNVLSKSMNNFIQNKFTPKKDKNIKQKLLNSRNRGKNLKSKIFVKAKHNQHTKFEIKKESNHEDTWKKRKNNMTSLKVKNSVKLDVGFQRNKSCYDFKKTNIDSNVVIKNDEKRKNYIFRIINNKYQDKCKKTGRKRTWKLGKINPKCQIADDIQSISRNFTNLNILTNDNVENI